MELIKTIETILFFSVGIVLEGYLLYTVRKELDFSMHFISVAFITGFFFRLPFLNQKHEEESPFYSVSTIIIFAILYYFVFKMM